MKSKLYSYRIVKETFADGYTTYILLYKRRKLDVIAFLFVYLFFPILITLAVVCFLFNPNKMGREIKEIAYEMKYGIWNKIHDSSSLESIHRRVGEEILKDNNEVETKQLATQIKKKKQKRNKLVKREIVK